MFIRRLFKWHIITGCVILLSTCLEIQSAGTPAGPATVKGVLIDQHCSLKADTRMVPDPSPHLEGGILWAYTHEKSCLLEPSCRRSGYGVYTNDTNKFLLFDAAGSRKALALIEASKKDDNMRVEVTGQIDGDKIKVASIKLLP